MKVEIGATFDVWWKLTETKPSPNSCRYVLVNEANGMRLEIGESVMRKIASGEQSVSKCYYHIIARKKIFDEYLERKDRRER